MKKGLYFWIKAFVLAIVLMALIRTFAFTSCTIPFSGMENSLYQGDRVIVNKWSYGLRTPFTQLFPDHRWSDKPVQNGEIILFNNPYPASMETAIDNREIFISRCAGVPGDTIMLDKFFNITSQNILSPDYKSLYSYPKEKEDTLLAVMKLLEIENNELISYNEEGFIRNFSHYEIYLLRQELKNEIVFKPLQASDSEDSHPFIIPGKGISTRVYPWNVKLLCNTILRHEGRNATIKGDTLLINGRKVFSYIFTKDYFWMASNNSINLNDSRLFGLVPKDHIIGKASFVWFSKDPEAGLLDGFRWDRFFYTVK